MSATNPNHYSRWKIQPWDFIIQNGVDFIRGNIIKYIMRFDAKNGLEDLHKARTYLDKLIECESGKGLKDEPAPANSPESGPGHIEPMYKASIAHITENDNELLSKEAFSPDTGRGNTCIFRHEAGFFIYIPSSGISLPSGASQSLMALYAAAQGTGSSWLNLDRDAAVDKRFTVYTW